MKEKLFAAVAGAVLLVTPALAQQTVRVPLGPDGVAKIDNSIRGSQYIDYTVAVGAGQTVAVTLRGKNASAPMPYFNFNPPGSDVSMFVGSSDGNKMQPRMVPSKGKYIIRIYQMGAAKSENKSTSFTLGVRVTGTALKSLPASQDAKLQGSNFHASGPIPCRISSDRSVREATAYVTRYGNGSGTIEVRAGETTRRILFVHGKPVAHDSAESFTYSKKGDDTVVKFGDGPSESYTISDMFINGG